MNKLINHQSSIGVCGWLVTIDHISPANREDDCLRTGQRPQTGSHADPRGSLAVARYQHHMHILDFRPAAASMRRITDQPFARPGRYRWWIERPFSSSGITGGDDLCSPMPAGLRYTGLGPVRFNHWARPCFPVGQNIWPLDRVPGAYRPFRAWLPSTTISCALLI